MKYEGCMFDSEQSDYRATRRNYFEHHKELVHIIVVFFYVTYFYPLVYFTLVQLNMICFNKENCKIIFSITL